MPPVTDPAAPGADPTPPSAAPTPPAAPPAADPPAADPPATDPPADPPADPPRSRSEERIEELLEQNKRDREASAELLEYWRQQALKGGAPATPAPSAPPPDPMPKLEDFDSTPKWADALSSWNAREIKRQAAELVDTTLRTRDETSAQNATKQTYTERMNEYEKTHPDVRRTINNPVMTRALQDQPAITEVVLASPVGPALAEHLAKNPAEVRRIAALPATQAAAAVGRIEATIIAKAPSAGDPPAPTPPKPAPSKGSRAPEPPSPIGGGGSPTVNLETCSIEDYIAIRGAQRYGSRGKK